MPLSPLQRIVTEVADGRRPALIRIIIGIDAVLRGFEARNIMLAVAAPNALQLPLYPWLGIPPQPWLDIYIGAWVALGIAFALGWRARWAGLGLFALTFVSLCFDQQTF